MTIQTRHGGVWVLGVLLSAAVQAADPLTFAEAQRIAEIRAPQIIANRAQEAAAREMAVAAGQLPDPVLKLGVSNLPISGEAGWSLVQEGMTMRQVSLMQEFTRSDKRQARAEKASREGDLARITQRQTLADTRREAALSWLDLAYQDSMRNLLATQVRELALQLQSAEAGFRAGRGEQADIFATRLAIERGQDQLAQMQRDIAVARAQLSRWIGNEAERPLGPLPDSSQLSWPVESLGDVATSHPTLAAQQGQVALAEAEARLARENRTPDVAVELMYSQRGPSYANMISLNVSMPLPWDRANRQDRELGAKLAQLDQAHAQQEDMQRAYLAELRGKLAAWKANRERLQRYDAALIPLSQQQVEAAQASYRAGNGQLARVLEARRMAVDTQMERQRIALETARDWAQLNFLNPQADQSSSAQGVQP